VIDYMANEEEENRRKILEAFSKLALKKSYQDISLKEISELAGISIASFYTYFDSKEDMLRYYIDYSLEHLDIMIKRYIETSLGTPMRIRGLIYLLSTLGEDERLIAFHRVFREVEFLRKDLASQYYERLIAICNNTIDREGLQGGSIDESIVSLSVIGSSEFIYLFRKVFEIGDSIWLDIEVAGDLVLKGIGSGSKPSGIVVKPPPRLADIVREDEIYKILGIPYNKKEILRATIEILGSKGFKDTKIYEIMDRAGYSVGMFYKVYRSKEELLRDLIAVISKTLRRYLTICTSDAKDPVEREVMGTACFLRFIRVNGNIYRIVRESEYIKLEIARTYYEPFMRSYAERIAKEALAGYLKTYSPESLAIALMGINHMAGVALMMLRDFDEKRIVESIAEIYSGGILGGSR